jgi:molybdopterin-guanine dinucleotide biosynthesis protein A
VTTAAIVLAGGTSRRFGADKLDASVDGVPLLQRAVSAIPADWTVIVVGPRRGLSRTAIFVREDPPGGGPSAAVIAGARAATAAGATMIATLPGDAPFGGTAAVLLARTLADSPAPVGAVIGVDHAGVDQPLQVAVRGPALQRLAGLGDSAGIRARRLLDELGGAAELVRVGLPSALTADVDRPEDLVAVRRLSRGDFGSVFSRDRR